MPMPAMPIALRLLVIPLLAFGLFGLLGLTGPTGAALAQDEQARCAQAHDPAHCMARLQAKTACRQERGRELQQCIYDHMPQTDCSRMQDSARCAIRQQAVKACHDKVGKERRACLLERGLH